MSNQTHPENDAHPGVHVLQLGYNTELFDTKSSVTSDGYNRSLFYARHVDSYTLLSLTRNRNHKEKRIQNLRVIPAFGRNMAYGLWQLWVLANRICKCEKITVLHAQEPYATGLVGHVLKLRYKLPISICVYGPNPWDKHWRNASWFNSCMAPVARFILRRADSVIVDGSLTRESLLRAGIAESCLVWKPLVPSNISQFANGSREPLRTELAGDSFKHLLLNVGNMTPQKNVPFILKAFAHVLRETPETRLIMIGRGRRKEQYERLAHQMKLDQKVLWIDAVPHTQMPAYYQACDVVMVGSRFEGCPRVLMEAAAAGRPVVTTEVSGTTDLVVNEVTGYVVAQNDTKGFARHVVDLIKNCKKAADMGKKAKPLIDQLAEQKEHFDKELPSAWAAISSKQVCP